MLRDIDRHRKFVHAGAELVVADDYATCLESLRAGPIDAATLGEVATLQAATQGGIDRLVLPVGTDGHVPTYRSAIFTRIDFPIRDLQDVRGKRMGLVDEQSASGYRMPRAMLREAGLDPGRDVRLHLLGRHRLVVEAVLDGTLDVGASHSGTLRPPSLDRGPEYARLRVLALSRNIPRGPLVVRATLSPQHATRVAGGAAVSARPRSSGRQCAECRARGTLQRRDAKHAANPQEHCPASWSVLRDGLARHQR
jgi:phosphonate transport system substrate-binding protein